MLLSRQTIFLSGLALSPALGLLIIPEPLIDAALLRIGPPGILSLAWVIAFGAAFAAQHYARMLAERTAPLMTPSAQRRLQAEAPEPVKIRASLRRILQSPAPVATMYGSAEPETPEYAMRRVLEHVLGAWETHLIDLDDTQLCELWSLTHLVQAEPGQAGELAQRFQHPDAVLDIRDRIARIARRRKAYEMQVNAFDATNRLWRSSPFAGPRGDLRETLITLDAPDPDLWHKVIVEHDPDDPAQRDAALWCAMQPGCERASVARFLGFAAEGGQIDAAARRKDTAWLAGLADIIQGWNAGRYKAREMGLTPPDEVARMAPALSAALDRLADHTGEPRLPEPRGVFAEYHGHAPHPRPGWCLGTGNLLGAPRIADYVDPAELHAA